MHIGILGGSFNPPHLGHLLVAQQVLDFTDIKEIWFLPAYTHTFDKPLAPVKDRVAMTQLINLPHTATSTLEIDHQLMGDTVELLPILKKDFSTHTFTFIIGSDQLPSFTTWGGWEALLKELPFLVVPRAGYPLEPLYPGMQPLTHELFITTNISSRMVRARIKQGLSIDHLVSKEIQEYITSHSLYQ